MSFDREETELQIAMLQSRDDQLRKKIADIIDPPFFSFRSAPYPGTKEYEPVFRMYHELEAIAEEKNRLRNELRRAEGLPARVLRVKGEDDVTTTERIAREHMEDQEIRSRRSRERKENESKTKVVEEFGDSPEVQIYLLEEQMKSYPRSSPEYRELRDTVRAAKRQLRDFYKQVPATRSESQIPETESDEQDVARRQQEEDRLSRDEDDAREEIPQISGMHSQTRRMPATRRSASPRVARRASSPARSTRRASSPRAARRAASPARKMTASRADVEVVERRRSRSCRKRSTRSRRTGRLMPARDPKTGRFLPRCK